MNKLGKTLVSTVLFWMVKTSAAKAATYYPLSRDLPLIGSGGMPANVPDLMDKLLGISVGLAALLAVIVLSIGGFKYMTSESVFNMGGAKEQMTNAIVGLLIVLAAVLVLGFINADIVSLKLFN